ncbi:MAG: PQQ-binding-like beta-propeller repeat protein [Pirellulaceae bacterium]
MNRRPLFSMTACTMLTLLVGPFLQSVAAQNWANWRGPEQDGVSREVSLPDTFELEGDKTENVLWVAETGGRATPIVLNGRVYLNSRTHHNVNDKDEKIHAGEQVICWDAATGEELWRDVFNVFQTDIAAPRVGWAAMCGDEETGNVYMHSVSGLFRCYTPEGDIVWEHSLHEQFGKISGYGGRTQTPIIDEDRVIVSFLSANWGDSKGPGPQHTYYAFDKRTGEVEWISAPGGAPKDTNYSVPLIAVIDGQRLLIGGNADGAVYAMQARTGKKVWGFQMSFRGLNTSPAVDGNLVYISHGEDNIDNTEFGRVQCIDGSLSGDITETGSVWRVDGIKAGYTAVVVKDGIAYFTSDTGKIYAYDSKTGEALWNHSIGTVGKGSPVWADGKLYVMEVNGNIRILKPSREGCEELCHVELAAVNAQGMDEIYASPAIAGGRIFLVTRDRLICVGNEASIAANSSTEVPPMPEEKPTTDEVATVLLTPLEVALMAGDSVEFTLKAYDANGNFIKAMPASDISVADSLDGLQFDGNRLEAPELDQSIAGNITATVGDITATARVRIFNNQSVWTWDFNDYQPMQVPPTWIRAFAKLKPENVPGEENIALKSGGLDAVRGRPSHMAWMGVPQMDDYTVQADVFLTEQKRRLSYVGITANRYNLVIKGNTSKLELQSWAAHLRLGASQRFIAEPNVWYTMKISVEDTEDGGAIVRGKVWPRDEDEPEEWTIEVTDPRGNPNGSPGLYMYSLADSYFDNIIVTQNDK